MRCEVTYIGRVQGVGFRALAKHLAAEHGVTGWVRNEADGSVRLVAEGSDEAVQAFLNHVRDRLGSYITDEQVVTGSQTGRYAGFEIR